MIRLRPYFIALLIFCFCGNSSFAQEVEHIADSIQWNLVDMEEIVENISENTVRISNNKRLERLLIESDDPISGEVEISIMDAGGTLVQNTTLTALDTRLVSYPSSMLATNIYMVSCSIAGEVWNQMVYVP